MESLLNAIDLEKPSGSRDKAMIELLYSSGLRVSELVNLELEHLLANQGMIRVLGKGNKERLVPLGRVAAECLEEYLNNYLSDDHNNVIIGREIGDSNFRNCSIVSKPFENNNINGQMLVLGPKRLPYKDIKIILTNFTDIINNVI